jgi:hypothetical protein
MIDLNRILFRLVNDVWTSHALDPCMIFLDRINDYGVVWLVLLGALAALGGKTGRWGSPSRVGCPDSGVSLLGGVKEYRDAAQALPLATRRAAAG